MLRSRANKKAVADKPTRSPVSIDNSNHFRTLVKRTISSTTEEGSFSGSLAIMIYNTKGGLLATENFNMQQKIAETSSRQEV
jgi:hypothetical protein